MINYFLSSIFLLLVWCQTMVSVPVQLDTTFGPNKTGMISTVLGDGAESMSVLVQSDGKIVIVGNCFIDDKMRLAVVRYLSTGLPDATFGVGGVVTTLDHNGLAGNEAVLQPDDKVVAVGGNIVAVNPQFSVVRYTTNGSLDATFAGSGIVSSPAYGSSTSVGVDSLDRIVVAGTTASTSYYPGRLILATVRINSDGTLDPSFGQYGVVVTPVGNRVQDCALVIQNDDKIVVTGNTVDAETKKILLVRYNVNGSLDSSFGTGGVITTVVPGTSASQAYAIALQADGKFVVVGEADGKLIIVRYTIDGLLDTSFGIDGFLVDKIGEVSAGYSVRVLDDGRILVGGTSDHGFLIARYTSVGARDTTFGIDGMSLVKVGTCGYVNSVDMQSDGKIIAAGCVNGIWTLARYLSDNGSFVAIDSPADGATIEESTFALIGRSSNSGSTVRIKANNDVIATVKTDVSGNWDAGYSPVLAGGTYLIKAELLDGETVVESETHSITLNPPALIQFTEPAGSIVHTNKPFIAGRSSSADATMVFTLDGEYWATTSTDVHGDWYIVLPAVKDGNHVLVADLLVDGSVVATGTRSFKTEQYACDDLRALGGTFTTGNPPLIISGSGNSCPPSCDFSVIKVDANMFNVTFGYPFLYHPIITTTVEKVRSINEGFVTIADSTTQNYVVLKLHGMAREIHFSAVSCRG